jgi:hypothetical protein
MRFWMIFGVILLGSNSSSWAAQMGVYAFPRNGQPQEQQVQDESFCSQWASQQTGLNPAVLQYKQEQAMAAQQQAYANANRPTPVRRLGRAALTGTAVGAMNKNMDSGAGRGAAVGATLMASRGLSDMNQRKKQMALDQSTGFAQSVETDTAAYLKAYGACMEGKGYSIG